MSPRSGYSQAEEVLHDLRGPPVGEHHAHLIGQDQWPSNWLGLNFLNGGVRIDIDTHDLHIW